jgi:hypothetical protein
MRLGSTFNPSKSLPKLPTVTDPFTSVYDFNFARRLQAPLCVNLLTRISLDTEVNETRTNHMANDPVGQVELLKMRLPPNKAHHPLPLEWVVDPNQS